MILIPVLECTAMTPLLSVSVIHSHIFSVSNPSSYFIHLFLHLLVYFLFLLLALVLSVIPTGLSLTLQLPQ